MLKSRNSAFRLLVFVIFSVFAASLTPSEAQLPIGTLTIVPNPPEGGTVTGAGKYAEGKLVTVNIKAANGWYIENVVDDGPPPPVEGGVYHLTPAQTFYRRLALDGIDYDPKFDLTTLTTLDTIVDFVSDTTEIITFGKLSPVISDEPTNQLLLTGSKLLLSAKVTGRRPMTFRWQFNGNDIPGEIMPTNGLNIVRTSLDAAVVKDSGVYSLTASNKFGSSSTSVVVDVRPLICFSDNRPLVTNRVSFTNSILLTLKGDPNGHIFYTLDGHNPDLASRIYGGPITLTDTAELRAAIYSSDFKSSELLDPIHFEKLATVSLIVSPVGEGVIEGAVGSALAGSTVSLRAIPAPGSYFVMWDGAGLDDNPAISLLADRDISLRAVFATPLKTPIGGEGTVEVQPNSPGYVPGTLVSLYPKPGPGYYFARWLERDDAVVPLSFRTGSAASPTALFVPLPEGEVSLTIIEKGTQEGNADVAKSGKYPKGTSIALKATGERFIRWSGDVVSTDSAIAVSLETSKTLYAEFGNPLSLNLRPKDHQVFVNDPVALGSMIELLSSTDLREWHHEFTKTNFSGFVFEKWQERDSQQFFKALRKE